MGQFHLQALVNSSPSPKDGCIYLSFAIYILPK